MKTSIGLIDDHQLFLKSLSLMIHSFPEYEVVVEALNGKDLQDKLQHHKKIPDIALVDVNMPVMDGIQTATWLQKEYPSIKLVALSMNDSDTAVLQMFKAGCCGYLLKDTHPTELEKALGEIKDKGYYQADAINRNFRRLLIRQEEQEGTSVSEREVRFLTYACSEMTYKQIASEMQVSERTVDGYRETLFQKLHVQSRVGMCLEAIRKGFVKL